MTDKETNREKKGERVINRMIEREREQRNIEYMFDCVRERERNSVCVKDRLIKRQDMRRQTIYAGKREREREIDRERERKYMYVCVRERERERESICICLFEGKRDKNRGFVLLDRIPS